MLRIARILLLLALDVGGALFGAATVRELLTAAEAKIQGEQFPAAEAILAQARKLDPADAEVLYRLGYVRYRQRNLTAARSDFAQVVKMAPPAWYSRYFLGRIALLENKPREAITWLDPILVANQSIFDTAAQLASAYAGVGLRDKAIDAITMAIAAAPWDGALYYRLGRLYTESGKRELAAEAYENSRRLRNASREDVETLMRVSQAIASGQPADAKQTADRLLSRSDADPDALVALGVIYGGARMSAEALQAFELAAARDPDLFQAQYNRGIALLKLNRADEALDPLARAVSLLPQSVEASRSYGLAAILTQRYAEAVAPLERAWAADPLNTRVGALLATAYLKTGAAKQAATLLAGSAFRDSAEPGPVLLRVEALNAAEDTAGALEAAQEAQRRFPHLYQTHLSVAAQLARLGRYTEAQPAFVQTLKLAPGHPEAELGLADTLSRSGDHAAAIEHYRAAIKGERTGISARSGLARSLIALRRLEEARGVLEEGISAYPSEAAFHVDLSRVYARLGQPELAAEQARIVEKLRLEGNQR